MSADQNQARNSQQFRPPQTSGNQQGNQASGNRQANVSGNQQTDSSTSRNKPSMASSKPPRFDVSKENEEDEEESDSGRDWSTGTADPLSEKIKQTWGHLTDDEIALYGTQQDEFYSALEEKYGLDKEEAEQKLKEIRQAYTKAA